MSDELEDIRRNVKKSDKLNYRTILQLKVDRCLSSINMTDFPQAVSALRAGMFFDVPGLPFRTEIKEAETILNKELVKDLMPAISDPNTWYHPYKRKLAIADPINNYNYRLMEFLIDLLAKHNALIAADEHVETGVE